MAYLLQKLNELRARQGSRLNQVPSVALFSESAALNVHFAAPHGEASERTPMASRSTIAQMDGSVVEFGLLDTLYGELWDEHVAREESDGTALLYIDRHLLHEVTSSQAYVGLRRSARSLWRVSSIIAAPDLNVPTTESASGIAGPEPAPPGADGLYATPPVKIRASDADEVEESYV